MDYTHAHQSISRYACHECVVRRDQTFQIGCSATAIYTAITHGPKRNCLSFHCSSSSYLPFMPHACKQPIPSDSCVHLNHLIFICKSFRTLIKRFWGQNKRKSDLQADLFYFLLIPTRFCPVVRFLFSLNFILFAQWWNLKNQASTSICPRQWM